MKKDKLIPQVEGDFETNPNEDTNLNIPASSESLATPGHSESGQPKRRTSAARIQANRNNAKKSTGPKTERGKAYSRRNAIKHGLLSERVLFSAADGRPINPELHDLWDSLHVKYGTDVRTELLLESVLVECWRQRMALNLEMDWFDKPKFHFSAQGNMPNLQRYRTASQRAMLKHLELLDKTQPSAPTSGDVPSDAEIASDPADESGTDQAA